MMGYLFDVRVMSDMTHWELPWAKNVTRSQGRDSNQILRFLQEINQGTINTDLVSQTDREF